MDQPSAKRRKIMDAETEQPASTSKKLYDGSQASLTGIDGRPHSSLPSMKQLEDANRLYWEGTQSSSKGDQQIRENLLRSMDKISVNAVSTHAFDQASQPHGADHIQWNHYMTHLGYIETYLDKNPSQDNTSKEYKDALDSYNEIEKEYQRQGGYNDLIGESWAKLTGRFQPSSDRFKTQTLIEIFPDMKKVSYAEKQSYNDVMLEYAQILYDKASKEYNNIFQVAAHEKIPIYCKWYGTDNSGIKRLVAAYDEIGDKGSETLYIGPTKDSLERFGIYPRMVQKKCTMTDSFQQILAYIQNGASVEWYTWDILKPLEKHNETYIKKNNDGAYTQKTGQKGFYFTNSYKRLIDELGGSSKDISKLFRENKPVKNVGPWRCPSGSDKEASSTVNGPKPKYGTVEKWK